MERRQPRACDVLIRNATVLTMDRERRVIRDGAVAVQGREIASVGHDDELAAEFSARHVIDAKGAVVHPGYIDAHVHVSHATARGALSDTVGFNDGMLFYAAWWRELQPFDEQASALSVATELLLNGTTCMVEAGTALDPNLVADAAVKVGIRALVADPWLWDVPNLAGAEDRRIKPSLERSLELVGSQLQRNSDDGLVRGYVALYGIGTSSDTLVEAGKKAARDAGAIFCQHQSYAHADVERDRERFGVDPILHYDELGVLDEQTMFVHMNLLTEAEVDAVRQSGMSVVACVSSEMSWGTGGSLVARHDELHHRGVPVALGCDSANSALRWDTSEQALLALLTARERRKARDAMTALDALELLTVRAATAIGLGDIIGSLEHGKRADIVVRSNDELIANPVADVYQNLVLTQRSATVHTVLVDGQVVVDAGDPVRIDTSEVVELVRASASAMLERIGLDSAA